MLVLAIDTTGEHGGVAIYRDLECLASLPNTGSSGYSVTLFQAVDQVLAAARPRPDGAPLSLRDIELFAVANGPGSFTGIRTGLAATQGWATALGRPTLGVSILHAMAHHSQPETEWSAAIMDARRDEFYLGFFRRESDGNRNVVDAVGECALAKPADIMKSLQERLASGVAITCVAREEDHAAQALRANLPGAVWWQSVSANLLSSIARLALEAHRRGRLQSPGELDASYIRRSDAELNWRF